MSIVRLRILGESVVEVGDVSVTPESPLLFALALYLGCSEGRTIHKSELLELLFPDVADRSRASHNLRQLLYRLRQSGAPIAPDGSCVRLPASDVRTSLDYFASISTGERVEWAASSLVILPAYEPRISRQLADWLETFRSTAQARLRSELRRDLLALEQRCEWEHVATVGRMLQELHATTEDIAYSVAQAQLMTGRQAEALDTIDTFLADSDGSRVVTLSQLRGRVLRARRSPASLESTFHGRRQVMHDLVLQWRQACEDSPQLAMVTGPAGIGKSRLAKELSAYTQVQGGQYLHYQCDRSDAARPYALFRSLLPQLRKMRGSLGASPELRDHLDLVCSDTTLNGALDPTVSETTKARIQQALIDLLEAVAAERPLLLVVDDAHLQDAASRSVTQALVSACGSARVMVVWCNRTVETESADLGYSFRRQLHRLMPLSEDESVAILLELLQNRQSDRELLRAWASRAGGNPYYLHAMAYECASGEQDSSTSAFDIGRFAASTYYGLSADARTLYDACVLLGPLATLDRVQRVAALNGPTLISALRDLEASGMICVEGGRLRCAHALLEEASLGLIPISVAAALHQSIARDLERECSAPSYPAALTWAASDHWIAIGEVRRAAHLLRRCASQAAALGEPAAAVEALQQIPLDKLDATERAALLSQLVDFAQAASQFGKAAVALQGLRSARLAMGCSRTTLREIEFQIAEADMRHGADPRLVTASLKALLDDRDASAETRLRVAGALLIAADMDLDENLAHSTYIAIKPELDRCAPDNAAWQRVELVYHSVFGHRSRALAVVDSALERRQECQAGSTTGRNQVNVFVRLGLFARARELLLADYEYLLSKHRHQERLYRTILLGEISLYEGDLGQAKEWVASTGSLALQDSSCSKHLIAGYYSAAAELALCNGHLDEAAASAEQAHANYPSIGTARYAAIDLSLRLRIQIARGNQPDGATLSQLTSLYSKGATLGVQDTIVGALWLAAATTGQDHYAAHLLNEYLLVHRREGTSGLALLRSITSPDPIWRSGAVPELCGA